MLKVALIQHACSADRSQNMALIAEHIQQAAAQGAQLVLLQELHNSLYFCVCISASRNRRTTSIWRKPFPARPANSSASWPASINW